jgi:pyruvate,water dikinase
MRGTMPPETRFTLWFDEIRIEDVPIIGGNNTSLGEMYQDLTSQGVKIPNGFATTSEAYWHFLELRGHPG